MGNVLGTAKRLAKLFGYDSIQWQATRKIGGSFAPVASAKGIGVMTSIKKENHFAEAGKFTRTVFDTIGKGILLFKTAGFFLAIGIAVAGGAGIGYLLGSQLNDSDKDVGLVSEKEEPKKLPQNYELPEAVMTKEEVNDYHPIETGGKTWAGIVQTYYPDLVKQCNSQLYGSDGAIRKLKVALQDSSGGDLIKATDIPKTLNLPLEIDGVKINKDAEAPKENINRKGGHTDIKEAGAKNTKQLYTVTDEERK